MPVLKWDPVTRPNLYITNTTKIGEHELSFSSSCVARRSPRCHLWRDNGNDTNSIGCVSPVPESVDELIEKMEEIISKLYPEEYLKALLQRVEDKAGGCRAGAEVGKIS